MNFTALLIVLGLGLDPTGITTQLNDGGIYDNYSDFEACKDFLTGVGIGVLSAELFPREVAVD